MTTQKTFTYLISACLVGVPCRWNGKSKLREEAVRAYESGRALLICPEVLGGLPTPRPACEMFGGDGDDVLAGRAKILDAEGNDFTAAFCAGAATAMHAARDFGIQKALLASGSPSCGAGHIPMGNFSHEKKHGFGVFAALLRQAGIEVVEIA